MTLQGIVFFEVFPNHIKMMRCDAFLADQIDFTNKRIWNQYHGAVKLKVWGMATVYQGTTIKIRCSVQGWEIDIISIWNQYHGP